ncbi:hypothetical protein K490DRAFT_39161 [Saccharata proteae CBS 121410]|uniref:Carbohydrate kinase PfkB domain-containing protein n=1 Tax=Saccharata proteae CBS 121410 TaxID=1314787 RepID=A0A9P4LXZ1_9PEZI|nr:hypothetical protein K490DRAFT_39161 [Saccharata proteae CBS 121410]
MRTPTKNLNPVLKVSEEVQEALHGSTKKPVVALETAIYTHGFPYPDNVALASRLESVVRTMGGVPATIGVLDGIARVGMDPEDLIQLAASAGKENTLKVSRRDLAYTCGLRLQGSGGNFTGGTTVAGTMVLAQLAGIKVFATGGLGGVHRGAENSMDISADLTELGRTPVAVISSGCKSFLDIPRTLEYLETQGVAVATFADGRTGSVDFPGFWSRESGTASPQTVADEKQAAAMIYAQHAFPLASGLLLANPIPSSASIPKTEIDTIISEAVNEAESLGISGNRNTPYILKKILELTKGKSIVANRALIESNVKRATQVAKELLVLEENVAKSEGDASPHNIPVASAPSAQFPVSATTKHPLETPSTASTQNPPVSSTQPKTDVVVAGSVAIDFACNYIPPSPSSSKQPLPYTSNRASITQTLGGVGHNIALAAHLSGRSVRLCSAVGDDVMGRVAQDLLNREGLSTDSVIMQKGAHTGQYVAINDANKDLTLGLADMDIIQDVSVPSNLSISSAFNAPLATLSPSWLIADANWNPSTLRAWLAAGKAANAKTVFEPVSASKAPRLFANLPKAGPSYGFGTNTDTAASRFPLFPDPLVDIATPNAAELNAMWDAARDAELFSSPAYWNVTNSFGIPASGATAALTALTSRELVAKGIPQQALQLLPLVPTILVTMGEEGVIMFSVLGAGDERLRGVEGMRYVLSRSGLEGEGKVGGVYVRWFRVGKVGEEEVVSVNGCGDTFTGVLVAGMAGGRAVEDVVDVAQRAAGLTLRSERAVSEEVEGLKGLLV